MESAERLSCHYNPDAICYTEDSKTFKSYTKQVKRWFSWRPSVRKNFKEVRKGLKFTILWVIGETLGFLAYLSRMIYLLVTLQWPLACLMLGVDALILSIVTYLEARRIFMVKQAMSGLIRYFFIRYVNAFLFFKVLLSPSKKW